LRRRFPEFDYCYYGDTANVPYGTKSPAQVVKLSRACAQALCAEQVDAVVVACNTASALALSAIREELGTIPVLGVLEPGVEASVQALAGAAGDSPVLVLATRATVKSGAYGRALRDRGVHEVWEQPCPLLVPLIEEDWNEHPVLTLTLDEYVRAARERWAVRGAVGDSGTAVALLGCTHYPWIYDAFVRALPGWNVVNSAEAVADAIARISPDLMARAQALGAGSRGKVLWLFSDPDAVPAFATKWIQAQSH
jgi:glutamate racemase